MAGHRLPVILLAAALGAACTFPFWAISSEAEGARPSDAGETGEAERVKKGYLVIDHEANDPEDAETMKKYIEVAGPLLKEYGGHFLVLPGRRNRSEPLQGDWYPESFSIIEFPSYEHARNFYYSDTYQSVLPIRLGTYEGQTKELLVEGR